MNIVKQGTLVRNAIVLVALAAVALGAVCTRNPIVIVDHRPSPEPSSTSVVPTRTPASTPAVLPKVYFMGVFEEPSTINFWDYWGGPGATAWTGYVLDGLAASLYDYSYQRADWVPLVADGFPTPLIKESVGGDEFWTTQVKIKKDLQWSDGEEITAHDFAFVVDTALSMELGGNALASVDPDFVDHVEALDSHTVKVFFKAADEEGNPQTPGLGVWQYGLAFTPILAKHYWEPIVAEAKQAGDIEAQQAALFAHVPEGEPTSGGFVFKKWEPGAFVETVRAANWFRSGLNVTEYQNGAYREKAPTNGYDVTYFGQATGPASLELQIGPHFDRALFSVFSEQDTAVLALISGEIDYLFNPQGLDKGFLDRIRGARDLTVVTNAANNIRYLGFNVRKAPMDNPAFRKAVALLIDKEFVAETVLQGAAIPAYSVVPEGNAFWHNFDVPRLGEGLERGERVAVAVRLLKDAGFTYEVEPKVSEDGLFVEERGRGLKTPDGKLVPELEILAPSEGYDPLRSTFAIWVERWLNDVGIPVRARLTGFDNIVDTLYGERAAEELDMWLMGWSLTWFPDYLERYFHSEMAGEGMPNFGGYANRKFDALAKGLLSETDVARARLAVFELQEFLAEDLPYVVLFSPTIVDVYRPSKVTFPYTNVLGGIQSANGLQHVVRIE